jgi:hypothetical protein
MGALSGYGLWSQNTYLNGKLVLPNAGITNEGTSSTSVRLYAGKDYDNRATAPFNVTQAGAMTATSGVIGGFTISANELYAGSGATRVEMQAAGGFWSGATAIGDAPFSVTPSGALTATGAVELGTAPQSLGGVSQSLAIKGGEIWETNSNSDDGAIHLNRNGYQEGDTKFRDVYIYDGKGNIMIKVDGSTNEIYLLADSVKFGGNVYTSRTFQVLPNASPPLTKEGVIYSDTDHHLYYYNGTTWKQLDN